MAENVAVVVQVKVCGTNGKRGLSESPAGRYLARSVSRRPE